MVRLRGNFGAVIFLALASVPATLVSAQNTGAMQPQAPTQNRQPVPQPNQQPDMNGQATSATAPQPQTTTSRPMNRKNQSAAQSAAQQQAQQAPDVPAAPPTLETVPPEPPNVSYRDGQLTIKSQNATLSQVLRSVQAQTGASIDIPGGANERVVANLGPGQPRDVLTALLNGSHFNYVILGTPGDTGGVQKVILTPRQSGPTTAEANQPRPAPQQEEEQQDEDQAVTTYPDSDVQQNTPLVPGQGPPGAVVQGEQNGNEQNQPNNGVKTPEQLLQELQRMQQQQQQYQQQLNPANQPQQQQQPQPQ